MIDWFILLAPLVILPAVLLIFIGCEVASGGLASQNVSVAVRWDTTRFGAVNYEVILEVYQRFGGRLISRDTIEIRSPGSAAAAHFLLVREPGSYFFHVQINDGDTGAPLLGSELCPGEVTATTDAYVCFAVGTATGALECVPCSG